MPVSVEPFRVLAPGKLVIAGEYAVLDGAPALVLAINSGVSCTFRAGPDMAIITPDGDTRFVAPCLKDAEIGSYQFETWNPPPTQEKPGFGGSASACVAACVAAGRPATDAFAIHKSVQGGGSGADVASSIAGGMIRFIDGNWTPTPTLAPIVVWSGRSARTGPRVQRYLQWSKRDDFVAESTILTDAISSTPIPAIKALSTLLRSMAEAAGLPYLTPQLEKIRSRAEELGGASKPSGAGGGDCAIALLPDIEAEQAFLSQIRKDGFVTIPVLPSTGAVRTSLPSPG